MADQLPQDLIHNIFSRLPVKSLTRYWCVNNPWLNYINDSYFVNSHLKCDLMLVVIDQFSLISLPNSPCNLSLLDHKHDPDNHKCLEVRKKSSVMEFTSKSWSLRHPDDVILGSCDGLLFTSQDHHVGTGLVVIHPLRKECYVLPPITAPWFGRERELRVGFDEWGFDFHEADWVFAEETYGLGFDKATKTFKMVTVMLRKQDGGVPIEFELLKENLCMMVHVLGSGSGSWRRLARVPHYPITSEGVFANGCLHWLISDENGDYYPTYLGRPLVWFDVTKEFGLIEPPKERPAGQVQEQLVDLNGQVGYVYNISFHGFDVWVLKERRWVMHCQYAQKPHIFSWSVKVLGFWNEKGNVLVKDNQMIFVYSSEDDTLFEVFDGLGERSAAEIQRINRLGNLVYVDGLVPEGSVTEWRDPEIDMREVWICPKHSYSG